MANDLLVTPGSGATIAAPEKSINEGSGATTKKVQRVVAGLGYRTTHVGDWTGDYANATDDSAGAIGWVRERPLVKSITANAISNSTSAYASGQSIGGLITFPNAGRTAGAGVILHSITVVAANGVPTGAKVAFFDASISGVTDITAPNVTAADQLKKLWETQLYNNSTVWSTASPVVTSLDNFDWGQTHLYLAGTTLYAVILATGAVTFTTTSALTARVVVTQL